MNKIVLKNEKAFRIISITISVLMALGSALSLEADFFFGESGLASILDSIECTKGLFLAAVLNIISVFENKNASNPIAKISVHRNIFKKHFQAQDKLDKYKEITTAMMIVTFAAVCILSVLAVIEIAIKWYI